MCVKEIQIFRIDLKFNHTYAEHGYLWIIYSKLREKKNLNFHIDNTIRNTYPH